MIQSTGATGQPAFRWAMLALIWLLYFSFGVAVASLAPLVETIRSDLRISFTLMGLVLGAWQLVYIPVAYFVGTVIDRLGPRRALLLGGFIAAVSLALRAAAVDFFSLFAIVSLFGVGGCFISIGAPKIAAVWFAGRERGVAAGIYSTAPLAGSAIALATANSVLLPLTGHWRYIFLIYGGVAALATVMWWLVARDRPTGPDPAPETLPPSADRSVQPSSGLRRLLRHRNVRVTLLLSFVSFFLGHSLSNWLPTVLTQQGMTPARAGLWASLPIVAGIFAVLLIPLLARHGYRAATMTVLFLAGAVSIMTIGLAGGIVLTGALVVSGVSLRPLVPVSSLVLMETRGVGAQSMGTAGGLFFAVSEVGGFSGPFLLGLLRDLTGTLSSGLVLLVVMAAVAGAVALLIRERE